MVIKKILAVSMAVVMALPCSMAPAPGAQPARAAVSGTKAGGASSATDDYRYFYYQLTPSAKKMYDAMYSMYTDGMFQKGLDCDLVEQGYVTQEQLGGGANYQLLHDMGAARDAFQYDYPDVFYVDFSALSLRVSEDAQGRHAWLGAGKRENYFLPGFTPDNIGKAVSEYEQAVEKAAELARTAKPDAGTGDENPAKTMIRAVHKYIVEHMVYKFENEVTEPGCNARTAYDCLIYGEGVCEAYTRGFKAVLDRLDIPNICVFGVYRVSETVDEEHIWNYVQIDGEWYGVDVTHDDPRVRKIGGGYRDEKKSGEETEQYLLVGGSELASHHIPSGVLSAANYEFVYPALASDALRGKAYYNDSDFKVKVMEDSHTEGGETIASGTVYVNYKGMNYTENAERGKYILARFATCRKDEDGNESWEYTKWGYISPKLYGLDMEPEEGSEGYDVGMGGHYIKFIMPHLEMIQFAVTTVEPDLSQEAILKGSLYFDYYGLDPALFTAMTDSYQNIYYSGYKAPPYPETVTPAMNSSMDIGGRNHVKAVYDQDLALTGGKFEAEAEVAAAGIDRDNVTAADYYKIENLTFDGRRTIEFDFTPSEQFADNGVFYNISFRGIAGKESGRALFNLTYLASFRCSVCAYRAQGFDWNVYGQPQLIDNADVAADGWIGKDIDTGEEGAVSIDSRISHRLTLVTTETSPAQSREMEKTLLDEETLGFAEEQILSSSTYNIKLTLCKKQIIRTGQGVRVSIGFPAGFSYDSSLNGVTFRAYHYITDDKTGRITGVEEIPLTVTPYGLVVTVDSFSPFTVAAIDMGGEAPEDPARTVILSSGENGRISADGSGNGILTLEKGGSATVHIKAADGYAVDTVSVGGAYKDVERGSRSMDISLDYEDVENGEIVDARFVAETVAEKEKEAKATVVNPVAEPVSIRLEKTGYHVTEGSDLTITPDIEEGNHTYQWYRGSEPLRNQTDKSLTIRKAEKADAGEYTLRVTNYAGTANAVSEGTCTVSVKEKNHEHTAGEPVVENRISADCVKTGSHDEVIHCTICNDVMERRTVEDPAGGHSFGGWTDTAVPTCTGAGSHKHTCSVCGYSEIQMLAPAHDWEETFTVDREATCTEEGSRSIHCRKCDAVKEVTPIEKTDHAFRAWEVSADGRTEFRMCAVCGYSEVRSVDPASPSPSPEPPKDTEPLVSSAEPGPSGRPQEKSLQEGDIITVGNNDYKVIKLAAGGKTGKVQLKGVRKPQKKVAVPASVTFDHAVYKVTSLDAQAFSGDKKLKTISIGGNVSEIGRKAFYHCRKIRSIKLPSSVKKIGAKAFCGCTGLRSVTFKTSKLTKKSVGSKAFSQIYKKVRIKTPKKKLAAYKNILSKAGIRASAKWLK